MKKFIRELVPGVKMYIDSNTGIVWAEDGRTGLGISAHPNINATGSVVGMKERGFWGKKDRTVRSHGWIYNIDRLSYDDNNPIEIAIAAECRCKGCIERQAPNVCHL